MVSSASTAYAQFIEGNITVTNSAGQYAGWIDVQGGGFDFSQGNVCPDNSNVAYYAGLVGPLVFYDTNSDPLPITPTTGLVWLQNDPSAGTCNNPPGPGFTVSDAGFSLQVYPYEGYDSDANWWNGTAVLTLNTPSNLPPTPVTGFIKPKYQILTVYYPPPGSASSASYQTGFTTGSAISNSSTFLNTESESVSLKTGFSATIPLASAKATLTAGETVATKGDSHSTEFSLDESLSASVFGFAASEDFKQSYTYSVTSTTSHTSNHGSNQTASVTIYRPLLSDGYAGPTLIKVYRDNVYGTFMFYGAE